MLLQYLHLILSWYQTSILRNFPNWQHWTFDVARTFSINIVPILWYHVPVISRQNEMSILQYLCYYSIDISFYRDIKLQYCEIFQSETLNFGRCQNLFNQHCPIILCRYGIHYFWNISSALLHLYYIARLTLYISTIWITHIPPMFHPNVESWLKVCPRNVMILFSLNL